MAKKYDIAQRIANGNQKPTIRIDEEHEYKVNNSKSAVLMMQAKVEDNKDIEISVMDDIITLALGQTACDEINAMELTFPAYYEIVKAIMAAFSLEELEDIDKKTENAKKGKKQ